METETLPAGGSTALFGVEDFPTTCPHCGALKVDGFVDGYYGWECGSKSVTHHALGPAKLRFSQSIECAVRPCKKRALKAEYLLSLIDSPNEKLTDARGLADADHTGKVPEVLPVKTYYARIPRTGWFVRVPRWLYNRWPWKGVVEL